MQKMVDRNQQLSYLSITNDQILQIYLTCSSDGSTANK